MGSIISLLVRPKPTSLDEKSSQPLDPNAALASKLRGKKIHVDMTNSFPQWPSGARNFEYTRLQRECDRVLEMYDRPIFFSLRGMTSYQEFKPRY